MRISYLKNTMWQLIGKPERAEIREVLDSLKYFSEYASIYNARIVNDGKSDILELTLYNIPGRRQSKPKPKDFKISSRIFFDGKVWNTQSFFEETIDQRPISLRWVKHYPVSSTAEEVVNSYCGGIDQLIEYQWEKVDAQTERRYKSRIERNRKRMEYVSNDVPERFMDWLKDSVFGEFRYFVYSYKSGGKLQPGCCTSCGHTFEAEHVKNGAVIDCPECGAKLKCRSAGKFPKKVKLATVSYVEPIKDFGSQPALCERIFRAEHSLTKIEGGAIKAGISFCEVMRIFLDKDTFKPLKDPKRQRVGSYFRVDGQWIDRKGWGINGKVWLYPYNIDSIIKESSSDIRNAEVSALIPLADLAFNELAARVNHEPYIEQIAKQGLYNLARAMLKGESTYIIYAGYMSCGQYKPDRVLGVSKETLRHFTDIDITMTQYILYKKLSDINPKMKWETFEKYLDLKITELHSIDSLGLILKSEEYRKTCKFSVEKAANYLSRQVGIAKTDGDDIIGIWRDYLSMAGDLKMEFTSSVLFPKNVRKEHDVLMKLKSNLEYNEENARLEEREEILEELAYSEDEYIIKPLRNAYDFCNESAVLGHCVKTYIKRCADGETNIFGIRKANEPDRPYYTLTLSNDCRPGMNHGKNNCEATAEVKDFVKRWEKEVLDKKRNEIAPLLKKEPVRRLKVAG